MIPAAAVVFLKRVPSGVWVALVALVALWWFGHARYQSGVQDEHERAEAAHFAAMREFAKARDFAEAQQRKTLEQVRTQHQRELADAIADRDSVIADLRNGTVRLRERFTCPSNASRLPEAAGTARGGNAAAPGGLLNADAEFLIRFASDADATAKQLKACQDVIRSYRQ